MSANSGEAQETRLPMTGLLALAMAGFITILTEALPAGLLPQMSAGLAISPSAVGQLVTVYALGSLVAAIPLTAATQRFRRKPVLLAAIAGSDESRVGPRYPVDRQGGGQRLRRQHAIEGRSLALCGADAGAGEHRKAA